MAEETMRLERHQVLRDRTKKFAQRIIKMSQSMPNNRAANVITNQILRSATSITANYRAAGRSRSKAEFIAKIGVVLEEKRGGCGFFSSRQKRKKKKKGGKNQTPPLPTKPGGGGVFFRGFFFFG